MFEWNHPCVIGSLVATTAVYLRVIHQTFIAAHVWQLPPRSPINYSTQETQTRRILFTELLAIGEENSWNGRFFSRRLNCEPVACFFDTSRSSTACVWLKPATRCLTKPAMAVIYGSIHSAFGAFCLDVRTLTFCQLVGFPY